MSLIHLTFDIPVDPATISQQSVRTSVRPMGGGRFAVSHYQPAEKMRTKMQLREWLKEAAGEQINLREQKDAYVTIDFLEYRFQPPATLKKWQKVMLAEQGYVPKNTKPDVGDNLQKLLFDALSANVIYDDARITEIRNVRKVYSDNVGITLRMTIQWGR